MVAAFVRLATMHKGCEFFQEVILTALSIIHGQPLQEGCKFSIWVMCRLSQGVKTWKMAGVAGLEPATIPMFTGLKLARHHK